MSVIDRRVVYIRAIDRPPVYIKFDGRYRLIERLLLPDPPYCEETGYFIRSGDLAEVRRSPRQLFYIKVSVMSEVTDEPRLKGKPGYDFA